MKIKKRLHIEHPEGRKDKYVLENSMSRIGVSATRKRRDERNQNTFTRGSQFLHVYEIKTYIQQMYKVRFTNGLQGALLSEQAVNEQSRWGNIEHKEKCGTRQIDYVTM